MSNYFCTSIKNTIIKEKKNCSNLFSLCLLILLVFSARLAKADTTGFLPTWKLLSREQKEQFVAGYIQGWQDAAKVTDIAIQYVEENPEKAVEGLVKIKQLYKIQGIKADNVVKNIDEFYSDPSNSLSPLSMAITAAKNRSDDQ